MVETPIQITIPKFRDECSLAKGVEVRDLLKVRKEAVLYVQPCVSERGKLMADVELKREEDRIQLIDPAVLCSILEIHRRRFAELKCSPNLGVAKLKLKGREISIFKNGKLKIQRALDREEILRVANSISRLVWGAVICDICGQPTISCASGKCGDVSLRKRLRPCGSESFQTLNSSSRVTQTYIRPSKHRSWRKCEKNLKKPCKLPDI